MNKLAIFALIAFLLLMAWSLAHPAGEIAVDLLLGWVGFLSRVLPRLTIRWDGVAVFASSLAAFAVLLHFFLRWLFQQTSGAEHTPRAAWKWRWTLQGLGTSRQLSRPATRHQRRAPRIRRPVGPGRRLVCAG